MDPNFTVYDDDDVISLLQKVEPKFTKKEASSYARKISLAKDYCLLPDSEELNQREEFIDLPDFSQVYERYEERLASTGNVDFGDLILRPYLALKSKESLRQKMYDRFKVILVDEYQDSNVAQFKLLEALSGLKENSGTYVCVVGDDDQSIYKFRGADVKNILNFQKIFQGTKIIRLESNYRSTPEILSLADDVVKNNSSRLGKTLRAERKSGKKPVLAFLPNQDDEVGFCAELVQKSHEAGSSYNEWAILYRTNAQSLGFESEFIRRKIPYTIVGSLKFFEREEIKDLLAYLELIANKKNEVAFQRIVNKPARSVGPKTQNQIIEAAREEFESGNFEKGDLIASCRHCLTKFTPKIKNEVGKFADMIYELESLLGDDDSSLGESVADSAAGIEADIAGEQDLQKQNTKNLSSLIEEIIKKSHLEDHYNERDEKDGTSRVENMEELANSALPYPLSRGGLLSFLDNTQLERTLSTEDEIEKDAVTLITLHNTKGLEFKRVIITGMEEGVFPRNSDDEEEMEEERRLCYVGITRAQNELYLTSCAIRRMYGHIEYMRVSPFLFEMDSDGLKILGHAPSSFRRSAFHGGDYGDRGLSHPDLEKDSIKKKYEKGIKIYHDDYGYGIVVKGMTNDEGEYCILVQFEGGGVKRFLPKYQEKSLMIIKD